MQVLLKLIFVILTCLVLLAGGYRAGLAVAEPLTLRDAIDILAEYEVAHPRVPAAADWYGITDFDARTIFVIENTNLPTKRKTVIHELLHVAIRMHGAEMPSDREEQSVMEQTALLYKALYQ